ncbi:hypothetical protein LVJ94_46505 [Pendulispora rubella]|uniref:Right handed beta helix domain-containing protein n=1 Tax=Pendulispora rubella TaxID=2741070 RepID=A0ABZ2L081_9BACT
MRSGRWPLFPALLASMTGCASRAILYASPDGRGTDCTESRPCDLAGAQARARDLATDTSDDITVQLLEGTYRLARAWTFGPEDSGAAGRRIVWQAAPGAHPTIHGGVRATGFVRIDEARNVWRAKAPAGASGRQMWVDGVRADRARTAHGAIAFTPTARGLSTVNGDTTFRAWTFRPGIEVMNDHQWKHLRCPVVGIEPTTDTVPVPHDPENEGGPFPTPSREGTTLVMEPTCWRINMLSPLRPGFPFHGSGMPRMDNATWVEGAKELLGTPGQFWFDSSAGDLYYVPRPGEDLTKADVELPLADGLLHVKGTPGHLTPVNDDDASAVYGGAWQHFGQRGHGDFRDDVTATQSRDAVATITFTGTGLDVLGERNADQDSIEAVVQDDATGAVVRQDTADTASPDRVAQQVVYSVAGLPKAKYRLTLRKHSTEPTWLVLDGYVVLPEPLQTVHDLAFRGLTFAYAAWSEPDRGGYIDNQAGNLWDPATGLPRHIPGAIAVRRGQRIEFADNTFTHLGGAGVELADGTQDSSIVGNRIDDVSGGGLLAGEVDDYYLNDTQTTRMTRGNTLSNNAVTNTGVDYHDTVGIWVGHARRTTVAHNLVAHASYTGISLGWGWGWASTCEQQKADKPNQPCRRGTLWSGANRIVGNRIYDVMRTLVDGGPIYTLGGQRILDGIVPEESGNAVSTAASCFHMLYHDEGSSYWRTHDNVVFNTGGHWLGIWLRTAHDNQIGADGTNYTDNPEKHGDWGSNNTIQPAQVLPFGEWPAAAQSILAQSGLEPAYRALAPRSNFVNDPDDGPLYSSDARSRQWQTSTFRSYGDFGGDVHYATADGAAVRFPFTGTGISVFGERNADQGEVEVYVDGTSRGRIDTSAPSRQVRQEIFAVHGLASAPHTLTVVKRSGSYATIDAFQLD